LTGSAAWRSKRAGEPVAQLVEHETFNLGVVGSIPTGLTKPLNNTQPFPGWSNGGDLLSPATCTEGSRVMSGNRMTNPGRGLGYSSVRDKWGWFVGLGVVLLLLGVFALGDAVAVTLISTVFIGAMLMVGGVFQVVHAFMVKTWSSFLMNLTGGVLYAIGGVLIMEEPVQGAVVITLFLIVAIVVGGILRIVIALRHREMRSWWLIVLSGLVSFLIGMLLYASLPWSGLWVLGTLVGIELIVQGITWLMFGMTLRRM
jgi:uncharacterized membrane protein HdeD (DUF308 family)